MDQNTILVELFTEIQAIQCCQALEAKGIASRYEGPATTGNSAIDWNLPTARFQIYVNEADLQAAELVMADIDFSGEDEAEGFETELEDASVDDEGPEELHDQLRDAPDPESLRISADAVRARNACILSLLLCCIYPFAIYLVYKASKERLRPEDSRNLSIGIISLALQTLGWLMVLYRFSSNG